MTSVLDDFFAQIVDGRRNSEVMSLTVNILFLKEEIVRYLKWVQENDPGAYWWRCEGLMKLFEDLYMAQVIYLPKDPVERFRWIATICLEASKMAEFDCTKVISPYDYLPADKFKNMPEVNLKAIQIALELRRELAIKGWKAVFGW